MVTHIASTPVSDDAVALLLECHDRIRAFIDLADRLATIEGTVEAEIARSADAVRRYFVEALPLHALDEEESVLPRLAGRDRQVDAALVTMHRDHAGHAAAVERVVALCSMLTAAPGRLPELAPALVAAVATLRDHFEHHLALEEEVVFPALRTFVSEGARAEIARELGARRDYSSR